MTMNTLRTAAIVAASMIGMGGGAAVIERPYYRSGPAIGWSRTKRPSNNRPAGFSFAEKKRRRKIARASRRYNLRTGA